MNNKIPFKYQLMRVLYYLVFPFYFIYSMFKKDYTRGQFAIDFLMLGQSDTFYHLTNLSFNVETGNATSKLYLEGKNCFGMKKAKQRATTAQEKTLDGDGGNQATYKSYLDSVIDWCLWWEQFPDIYNAFNVEGNKRWVAGAAAAVSNAEVIINFVEQMKTKGYMQDASGYLNAQNIIKAINQKTRKNAMILSVVALVSYGGLIYWIHQKFFKKQVRRKKLSKKGRSVGMKKRYSFFKGKR